MCVTTAKHKGHMRKEARRADPGTIRRPITRIQGCHKRRRWLCQLQTAWQSCRPPPPLFLWSHRYEAQCRCHVVDGTFPSNLTQTPRSTHEKINTYNLARIHHTLADIYLRARADKQRRRSLSPRIVGRRQLLLRRGRKASTPPATQAQTLLSLRLFHLFI